ncbi:hypothetical protein [Polaribacter ponticola]|uniref:Carboxypeptidase-like regulatory domain-containing protein n=1 Tax=Polaribacter ponticola TaxID=2978475 RepID=A0ABT5SCR5_9FLAO|nr:hypothetical protein [Polaribacter sp. MSW5]MDD7915927.1 hypothetical protein [Polaribacter sp. MSW5]
MYYLLEIISLICETTITLYGKKTTYFISFFISTSSSFSQEKNKIIIGTILDSLGIVKNANIINLNTKQGTFSSDLGLFRIFVSEGDSISVSSIQHISKKFLLQKI